MSNTRMTRPDPDRMSLTERLFHFDSRIEAAFPPLGPLQAGTVPLHHVRTGPRGGPVLVLIHGASGNLRDWQTSLLPALALAHDVIALDRPGFGHSPATPRGWRLTTQITKMRAALHALGVTRYVLAGHSYGGALAMRWAQDHPDEVQALALIAAPVMDWGGGGIGLHYQLGGRLVTGWVLSHLARLITRRPQLAQSVKAVFAPQPVTEGYLDNAGVQFALRPGTFRDNARMMLRLYPQMRAQSRRNATLTCPVEIIHGDADTIVPASVHAEPLARLLPHGTLTLLPGIGHMPHHACADIVQARLTSLLSVAEAQKTG